MAGTRLADVAAAVGITGPAVYYHFANLEAVLAELLDYVVTESAAFATAVVRRPGPAAERLHSLLVQHVERLIAGPYDLWFVAGLTEAEMARFPHIARQANRWRRAVARLVGDGVAAGEFRPVDADLAVAAVSGLVYGVLRLRHDRGRVEPAQVADLAVSAIRGTEPDLGIPVAGGPAPAGGLGPRAASRRLG